MTTVEELIRQSNQSERDRQLRRLSKLEHLKRAGVSTWDDDLEAAWIRHRIAAQDFEESNP